MEEGNDNKKILLERFSVIEEYAIRRFFNDASNEIIDVPCKLQLLIILHLICSRKDISQRTVKCLIKTLEILKENDYERELEQGIDGEDEKDEEGIKLTIDFALIHAEKLKKNKNNCVIS